ncbi:two-component system response regulator [Gammaproteobacteria bacterium 53_120_T64]|nr:two-component system response regulator [Gammaproteobacteria bacterium 53_120_T64]
MNNPPDTDGERYLIVDDDEIFADTLARSLQRRGPTCYVANDEVRALELCRLHRPSRAILDLKLLNYSGLHLIEQLKAIDNTIAIVILTGYSSIPTAVEAIKLGAKNYLCKPAGLGDILSAFDANAGNADSPLAEQPPSVNRLEWEHIQRILQENDGNISATARALGMHRRTLQRKLQKRPMQQ